MIVESTFESDSLHAKTTVCPSGETSGVQHPCEPGSTSSPPASVSIQIAAAVLPPGSEIGPCHARRIVLSDIPAPRPVWYRDTGAQALDSRFQVHKRRVPSDGSTRPTSRRVPSALQSKGKPPMPTSGTFAISPVRKYSSDSEVRIFGFLYSGMLSSGLSIVRASRNCSTERIPSEGESRTNAIGSAGKSLSAMLEKHPAAAMPRAATRPRLADRPTAEGPRSLVPFEESRLAHAGLADRDDELRAARVGGLAVRAERPGDVGV